MAFQCSDVLGCTKVNCIAQHNPTRENFLKEWIQNHKKDPKTQGDPIAQEHRNNAPPENTKTSPVLDTETQRKEQEEMDRKRKEAKKELERIQKEEENKNKNSVEENVEKIKDTYPTQTFFKHKIRGDGYCILNSTLKCLKHTGVVTISSKERLLEDLRVELHSNIEEYKSAINTEETDPIQELEEYTKTGQYNTNLGDLIIPLLSNQLGIRIVLLQQKGGLYVLEHEGHVYAPNYFTIQNSKCCHE